MMILILIELSAGGWAAPRPRSI